MEQWNKIPNYSLYEASTMGRIKTFNWKNKGIEAIMKPALDNSGYLRTMLKNDNGKFETIKVHRIIAQTFIPNPNQKATVNHKNFIRTDNRLENLEWCTLKENIIHSFTGKRKIMYGEKNHCASLTDEQVIEIRKNYISDKTVKNRQTKAQIADKYNTTFAVIKRIIHKKTWKHLL